MCWFLPEQLNIIFYLLYVAGKVIYFIYDKLYFCVYLYVYTQ